MAYTTIFNQRVNQTEILTVEADTPEKAVYVHRRNTQKRCGDPNCVHTDCGDAHISMTWAQAQELGDTLSHYMPYADVEAAVAQFEDYECAGLS